MIRSTKGMDPRSPCHRIGGRGRGRTGARGGQRRRRRRDQRRRFPPVSPLGRRRGRGRRFGIYGTFPSLPPLVHPPFVFFELHNTSETLTTHTNPTPMSIFKSCAGKSSRLTKSPQAPRCRRGRRLPLKAQTSLNLEKFAPMWSRTQDLRCYRGSWSRTQDLRCYRGSCNH
jgi:hypothetical protein